MAKDTSGVVLRGFWITLYGAPRTKKNHQRLVNVHGRMIPVQSQQYKTYEHDCLMQLQAMHHDIPATLPITTRINLRCVYYMPTKRRVDLANLIAATCDILVRAGVLEDDNVNVVASHDGSRVLYDKEFPRAEIEITEE